MRLSNFCISAAVIGLTLMAVKLSGLAFAAKHNVVNKEVSQSVQKAGQTSNKYSPTIKWTPDKKYRKFGTLTRVKQQNFDKFQNAITT